MRSFLLWCASNPWLSTHVPTWGFARRAVKRFMPGEDLEAALKAAAEFKAQGVGSLLTRLGENVKNLSEAGEVVEFTFFLSTDRLFPLFGLSPRLEA